MIKIFNKVLGTIGKIYGILHRVYIYRVPGLLPSRPNWVPPTPHPGSKGETHSLAGKRVRGDPIPTMGQTLWYSMYAIFPNGISPTNT